VIKSHAFSMGVMMPILKDELLALLNGLSLYESSHKKSGDSLAVLFNDAKRKEMLNSFLFQNAPSVMALTLKKDGEITEEIIEAIYRLMLLDLNSTIEAINSTQLQHFIVALDWLSDNNIAPNLVSSIQTKCTSLLAKKIEENNEQQAGLSTNPYGHVDNSSSYSVDKSDKLISSLMSVTMNDGPTVWKNIRMFNEMTHATYGYNRSIEKLSAIKSLGLTGDISKEQVTIIHKVSSVLLGMKNIKTLPDKARNQLVADYNWLSDHYESQALSEVKLKCRQMGKTFNTALGIVASKAVSPIGIADIISLDDMGTNDLSNLEAMLPPSRFPEHSPSNSGKTSPTGVADRVSPDTTKNSSNVVDKKRWVDLQKPKDPTEKPPMDSSFKPK